MERIVVGVDGSEGSKQAMAWAAREATVHGAALEVVYAYEHRPNWSTYGTDEHLTRGAAERIREEVERGAQRSADEARSLVASMVERLDLKRIEAHAIETDHPARALVDHAKGADLLVVGSRGRGSFKSLMLGSVSQQCAHHADCPVVIIRSVGDVSE